MLKTKTSLSFRLHKFGNPAAEPKAWRQDHSLHIRRGTEIVEGREAAHQRARIRSHSERSVSDLLVLDQRKAGELTRSLVILTFT